MESGEKELRMAFEEVTTRNVQAAVNYSNETRNIVRQLEQKILHLEELAQAKDKEIAVMRQQIAIIQGKLYNGGTT
jgi:uncharacterized protein HemX